MKHRISPSTIIATLALFFSLGGASLAASHYLITNIHQIKPSVRTKLRSAQGPAGPAGPTGRPGQTGPAGPTGPPGAPGRANSVGSQIVESAAEPVGAGDTTISVVCPDGTFLLGGGYTGTGEIVTSSEPLDNGAAGWRIVAHRDSTATTATALVVAMCSSTAAQ